MTTVLISTIRTDGGTQSRAALDEKTVERYAELLTVAQEENGEVVWPFKDAVEVCFDGKDYWLWDGFHRVAACTEAGIDAVEANVSQGTQRDAILQSFSANADHGLPSSTADKRRAITRMLQDDEWSRWSDREIARRCKASHPTVAAIRAELAEVTGKFTSERVYVDRNGNEATMNVAKIGGNVGQPSPQVDSLFYVGPQAQTVEVREALQRYLESGSEPYGAAVKALADENSSWYDAKMERASDALGVGKIAIRNAALTLRNSLSPVPYGGGVPADSDSFPYNPVVSPAVKAYTRSEIRHLIAEANRTARTYFPAASPASLYHGWAEQGEKHPQYHFMRTATGHCLQDMVAAELAGLCRCNPIAQEAPTADPIEANLDQVEAAMAAEVDEMFADEEDVSANDSDEWYTPAWLIEKANAVMGGIDIDPASSPAAQERVQAANWFGKDYMGLGTGSLNINWVHHNGPHWQPARVWLNPPYSFPLVGQFVEKLLEQIEKGYVGEAILLVNNNTETDWWHKAASAAAVTFAFRSRVFFWRPGREDATSPRQGQTAFYFGDNALEFIETFKDKGMSFMRWDTSVFNEEEE